MLLQELNQADISVIKKKELQDRLTAIRKAFDKLTKEREQALQKAEIEKLSEYFKANPNANAYIGLASVEGNAKVSLLLCNHEMCSDCLLMAGRSSYSRPGEEAQ